MGGWRSVDGDAVASRHAVAQGMVRLARTIAARADDTGGTTHVVAVWQDASYVEEHGPLLAQLARATQLTVACVGRPALPDDVEHVELDADEPLAHEWTLLACGERTGAALVAREVGASLPAPTVDAGTALRWQAVDDDRVVVAHARRLLRAVGARLTPERSAELLGAVTRLAAATGTGRRLVDEVGEAIEHGEDARREEPTPAGGGLAPLARWLSDAGPRSPALGMVVVRSDVRGAAAALREEAASLGRLGDLVVDVPPDAAMLVLPGLTAEGLRARADEVAAVVARRLATDDVEATWAEVAALDARRDLVGTLGRLVADLRAAHVTA